MNFQVGDMLVRLVGVMGGGHNCHYAILTSIDEFSFQVHWLNEQDNYMSTMHFISSLKEGICWRKVA